MLDPLYIDVQAVLVHPQVDADTKKEFEHIRDVMLRLRFWDLVTKGYATTYASRIEAAHKAAGLAVPRFEGMTRAAAVAHVDEWKARKGGEADKAGGSYYDELAHKGLFKLDATVIFSSWI